MGGKTTLKDRAGAHHSLGPNIGGPMRIDWRASNRLHDRGLIDDPKNKNKSVIFTEEGLALARASAESLFSPGPSST